MTKVIGLTGGIGSGKTTIATLFMEAGIPVYIADDEAKKLMQSATIIEEVKAVFGSAIYENEILNRKKLAEIVFKNKEQLTILNNIIHPAVKNHFDNWLLNHVNYPFVIYEAAILFESGSYKNCDKIIAVTAPIETRIERVMKRDNCTQIQVLERINAQWTDEKRNAKSDFVITTISFEQTKIEVRNILKILNNYQS